MNRFSYRVIFAINMNILKRNYIHRNVLLFLVFTIFYMHALDCLAYGVSIASFEAMNLINYKHVFIWFLVLMSFFSIFFVRKHSEKFLLATLIFVSLKNFMLLSYSFNKLILLLDFVYLLFAFYFYVAWELETKRACFRPRFSKNDLEKESRAILSGELLVDGKSWPIHLSNLDENSCFLILKEKLTSQELKEVLESDEIYVASMLEEVNFKQKIRISAKYDRGLGVEFLNNQKDNSTYDYPNLYKICLERGYFI